MSALILRFPLAASVPPAQSYRRAEIVAAARAVLRSAASHGDDILTEACVALQTYGDGTDWLEADILLASIVRRDRAKAHAAAKRGGARAEVRLAALEVAAFAAFAVAVLVVGLAL